MFKNERVFDPKSWHFDQKFGDSDKNDRDINRNSQKFIKNDWHLNQNIRDFDWNIWNFNQNGWDLI